MFWPTSHSFPFLLPLMKIPKNGLTGFPLLPTEGLLFACSVSIRGCFFSSADPKLPKLVTPHCLLKYRRVLISSSCHGDDKGTLPMLQWASDCILSHQLSPTAHSLFICSEEMAATQNISEDLHQHGRPEQHTGHHQSPAGRDASSGI